MLEVLNMDQLAEYLGMSKASIYHLVASGKIPGTKIGKQWRFSRSAIDEWLSKAGKEYIDALVVEDDPVIRDVIVRALRAAGHHTAEADSVQKARTLLDELAFDIVFLDMLLPDGTGLDIVHQIQQMGSTTEVVIVTGNPNHEAVEEVRNKLPYVTILGKPVRLQVLLDLASRAMKKSSRNIEVDDEVK